MLSRRLCPYLLAWMIACAVGCRRSGERCMHTLARLEADMNRVVGLQDLREWSDDVLRQYDRGTDVTRTMPETWKGEFMTVALVVEMDHSGVNAIDVFRRSEVGSEGFLIARETTVFPRVSECQRLWKPGILMYWDRDG